jgi:hypothetical protein
MPFYVEKGPQFSVIESFVFDDPQRGIDLLHALRANTPAAQAALSVIGDHVGLQSTALDQGPDTADERIGHLNSHWFEQRSDHGAWTRDLHPQQPAVDTYGRWWWWQHYAGDVYEIMRQTMIRAGEVSLGIGPGEDVDQARHDPWPIELFWHCSQNWFEGWVTWRRHGTESGQVTVLLCTPTAGAPVRPSPLATASPVADRPRATAPTYAEDPPTPGGDRGMVVVTHSYHEPVPLGHTQLADSRGPGQLTGPWRSYWRGRGPVIAVMPSEPDGGVRPNGRAYV